MDSTLARSPEHATTLKRCRLPRCRVGTTARMVWAAVALGCAVVLGIAVYLKPNPAGLGTHRGLSKHLPPCGFVVTTGLPCPTCGMTTAFSNTVRGRLIAAFIAQPAGLAFCLGTIACFLYGLTVAVTGWTVWINWDRISVRLMIGLGLLILGGWGFKLAYGLAIDSLPIR
ncbi:MAG: DUF2752 domain-containing protein [Phycisphaerae bacterium]